MKTQVYKLGLLIFATLIFNSCTSLLYTTIDVLRPAKVNFIQDANNLLIVNNTIKQPNNFGHKNILINQNPKNINFPTDSLALFCIEALNEDIQSKDFFSTVKLIPTSINHGYNYFSNYPLSSDTVKRLCTLNNSTVILSLDKIKLNDELSEYYLNESALFLGTLELRFETTWSIHYLNHPEVQAIQFNDTVFWQSEDYSQKKAMSEIPLRKDAFVDGALNVGHKMVNRFIPYWEKADRYFFNPTNKIMKQGMDSVYVKNWSAAVNIWLKAYNNTKNRWLQAQAANNIAIGYEILGNFDKSIEYANNSYYLMGQLNFVNYQTYSRIEDYIVELTRRKHDVAILKKQLGN